MPGAKPYSEDQLIAMLSTRAMRYYAGSACRNRALFAIALSCGCRVSELVAIRRNDLLDEYGRIRSDLRIWQSKQKRYRVVPVANPLVFRFLPEHLEQQDRLGYFRKDDWLFPGRNGNHLSVRTVNRIYGAAHRELRLTGYSSHSTRKTWAVQIYTKIVEENRRGRIASDPFEKLCQLGGWESYDAARRYIADAVDNRRAVQEAIYPRLNAFLDRVSDSLSSEPNEKNSQERIQLNTINADGDQS